MKTQKKIIHSRKKLYVPYNPSSLNQINKIFKDMTLGEKSQWKALIYQEHSYFSVLSSEYAKPQTFQESWHNKDLV